MIDYESKRAREAARAKKAIETAREFRRKRDKTGGGYISEFEHCRKLFLTDPWTGLYSFYDLGFSRGYKQAQEATRKRYKKKLEALEERIKALEG